MKKWITKSHIIYTFSLGLFILSLFGTHQYTSPKGPENLIVSKTFYDLNLTQFPFSVKLTDQHKNNIKISQINLFNSKEHYIPLDYFVDSNNKKITSKKLVKEFRTQKESHSFIVSSHMRRDLLYKITVKTRHEGVDVSLFPMNAVSKVYSRDKKLKLSIVNNDISKNIKRDVAQKVDSSFYESQLFSLKKFKDHSSKLKVNIEYNKLTVLSFDNKMSFTLDLKSIVKTSGERVSFKE